jgi:hypothetical protein
MDIKKDDTPIDDRDSIINALEANLDAKTHIIWSMAERHLDTIQYFEQLIKELGGRRC